MNSLSNPIWSLLSIQSNLIQKEYVYEIFNYGMYIGIDQSNLYPTVVSPINGYSFCMVIK